MLQVKTAADIMRRSLVTLSPDTKVLDGVARLLRDNISGAPVVNSDHRYLGVFSEKCCMNALTGTVETAAECGLHMPLVRDFMTCKLVTLSPEADVFVAIDHLLKHRISGAPVVDREGHYEGIFSEKTAMQVLIAAVHDQLPGSQVASYMNLDRNRIINDEDTLLEVAHKFQNTGYRRLPVVHGSKLAGQVSRRDVLRAEHRLAKEAEVRAAMPNADPRLIDATRERKVGDFMDVHAQTATPEDDMLTIAQAFLNSPYRRLPILHGDRLLGQVSRRDLLETAAAILRPQRHRHTAQTLYLSPISATAPPSLG